MEADEATALMAKLCTAVSEWTYSTAKGRPAKGREKDATKAVKEAFKALTGAEPTEAQLDRILGRCGLV